MKSNVKRLFAGPYILWMIGFTIIPLLLIVYYGLTTKSGTFTLANVCSIATLEHLKALLLSLGLSLAATAICLLFVLSAGIGTAPPRHWGRKLYGIRLHPSDVDEFPAPHPRVADASGEKWRHQWHSFLSPSAKYRHHQYTVGDHSGYGIQLPAFHDSTNL